jgi:hypothetical protein
MNRNVFARIAPLLIFMFISVSMFGQEPENDLVPEADTLVKRVNGLRIFIDCARCDMNYIREEVPYVNYVRDVKEAQLYIMETSDMTGSGGRRYTYAFVGQQEFAGMNDTLVYSSRPDDSRDYQRIWRTQMLKMGLMPYVAKTPLYSEVLINPAEREEQDVVEDKWNNWVFELEAEPDFEGEESYKELELRSSVSATKITHDWKLELDFDHRYTRTKYTYDDTLYTNYKSYGGLDLLVVKSLGEHWSAGLRSKLVSSSYTNIDLALEVLPSVEYNVFPYSKSTHRQLRILYGIGSSWRIYNDTTIYDKTEELLWQHQLEVAYQVQEKWGSVNVALEGSNYFHDFSKNRVELSGYVSIRILKGLSLRIRGGAARINDQLSLVKGEASEAEILLQLQELETTYNLEGGLGLTYTFGSIYNNIVNPRFGNGRRYF